MIMQSLVSTVQCKLQSYEMLFFPFLVFSFTSKTRMLDASTVSWLWTNRIMSTLQSSKLQTLERYNYLPKVQNAWLLNTSRLARWTTRLIAFIKSKQLELYEKCSTWNLKQKRKTVWIRQPDKYYVRVADIRYIWDTSFCFRVWLLIGV